MKISVIPLAVIAFLHVLFLLPGPVVADLIDDTCNRTTLPDTCTKTLRSYPQSSSADLSGLAGIIVNASIANGNETLGRIQALVRSLTTDLTTRKLLDSCEKIYVPTVSITLPRARAELLYGAYELAREDFEYASDTPRACEYGFSHEATESPLKDNDKIMIDLTELCLELVNLLIEKQSK